MKITPLQTGRPNENIDGLASLKLTKYSPREAVLTESVINLLKVNDKLSSTSFERFRAKSIGVLVGASLPLAIATIFGVGIYSLYQAGTLAHLFVKAQTTLSLLANKIFVAMTASKPALAASTGGAVAATVLLTRPGVHEAIGSFVGSFFGSFTGSTISNLVKDTQKTGYNWWVDKYNFTKREKTIEDNHTTIKTLLTDVYKDMAESFDKATEASKTSPELAQSLKERASILKKQIPLIHAIFEKQGIAHNQAKEITMEFEESIGSAL